MNTKLFNKLLFLTIGGIILISTFSQNANGQNKRKKNNDFNSDIVKNYTVNQKDFYPVVIFTQRSTTFRMPFKCADPVISDYFILKAEATDAVKDNTLKIQKVDTPKGPVERVITPYAKQFAVSYVGGDLNIEKATSTLDFTCEDEQSVTVKVIVKGQGSPNDFAIKVNFLLEDFGNPEMNELANRIQKQERQKWSQRIKRLEEESLFNHMNAISNALKEKSYFNKNTYQESNQFLHTKTLHHMVLQDKGYGAFEIKNRARKPIQLKSIKVIQKINSKEVPLKTVSNFKPLTMVPGFRTKLSVSYFLNEDLLNIIKVQGKRHAHIHVVITYGEKGENFKIRLNV